MKKRITILAMSFSLIAVLVFQVFADDNEETTKSEKSEFRYVENNAFDFGEKLVYEVGYKFITAGMGYFHVRPKPARWGGRDCYDIRFEVRSLKSLEWLYKVKDVYRTVIDVEGIFPWHFEQHIREGNYKRDFKASFDQKNNYAITELKGKKEKYKVDEYVHDIVSAFFYVRTMDIGKMKKGTTFYLKNFYKDSTYDLGVRILGKEIVEVEAGKFRCIKLEPLVVEGGLFKNEGSILIWLTDDDRKIPVKVGTEILIGFVGAELKKYSGIKGKIDAKIE